MSPGAFDASKPFTTRDGRAVSGLYRQPNYVHDYVYGGLVESLPRQQVWARDGSYIIGQTTDLDLVNVPDVPAPVPLAGGGEDDETRVWKQHCVELEQCSLFVDSAPLKKAMTDAATFFRAALPHRSANQATRDEVIEECARVAEEHGSQFALAEAVCTPGVFASLAKAIRALKQEPASDGWLPIDSAPQNRRGIYIASKTRHADKWRHNRDCGIPIISTWIDEAGPGESTDLSDLWRRCIAEASSAGALILYRENEDVLKGGWIELGAALAARVPVFAVGIEDFTVSHATGIVHCDTIEIAFTKAFLALPRPQAGRAGVMALIAYVLLPTIGEPLARLGLPQLYDALVRFIPPLDGPNPTWAQRIGREPRP